MVGSSRKSNVVALVVSFDDPFVSFFIGRVVGSNIKVTTVSSDIIVRSKEIMLRISSRSNSEEVILDMIENEFVSLFTGSMSSNIEIGVVSSNTIVGSEEEVVRMRGRSNGNLDINSLVVVVLLLLLMEMMEHFLRD